MNYLTKKYGYYNYFVVAIYYCQLISTERTYDARYCDTAPHKSFRPTSRRVCEHFRLFSMNKMLHENELDAAY